MEVSTYQQKELLTLVRHIISSTLEGVPIILPTQQGLYAKPRGAFVTLHKEGHLRGCIGHIIARTPLLETIKEMAHAAAFRDPRFPPVTRDELDQIDVEISVLTPLEVLDDPTNLIPGVHGLYITGWGRSGVLLPQVATEQGWDRETFLTHTCYKAGLPGDAWEKPGLTLEVFTAQVFGELINE